jgi:hypothetical protein
MLLGRFVMAASPTTRLLKFGFVYARASDGTGAIPRDLSAKYHCCGRGMSAYDGSRALKRLIRHIEIKNFFVGLGDTNVVLVREYHGTIPPALSEASHRPDQSRQSY